MPTFECPTCRKMHTVERRDDAPFRPFCCERCKLIDLGKWLDGTYRVSEPARPEDYEAEGINQDDPPIREVD